MYVIVCRFTINNLRCAPLIFPYHQRYVWDSRFSDCRTLEDKIYVGSTIDKRYTIIDEQEKQ